MDMNSPKDTQPSPDLPPTYPYIYVCTRICEKPSRRRASEFRRCVTSCRVYALKKFWEVSRGRQDPSRHVHRELPFGAQRIAVAYGYMRSLHVYVCPRTLCGGRGRLLELSSRNYFSLDPDGTARLDSTHTHKREDI
jgi:hypothetical protein